METTFKVGDRVRFKSDHANQDYRRVHGLPEVVTISEFIGTIARFKEGRDALIERLELAPPTITLDKTYRTRDGREVCLQITEGAADGQYPVIGVIKDEDGWSPETWTADGRRFAYASEDSADLIEVKPQITKWANIYACSAALYDTREQADNAASHTRVACKEITYHDGEGL